MAKAERPIAEWRAGRITMVTITVTVLVVDIGLPLTLWEQGEFLANLLVSVMFALLGLAFWWMLAGRLKASVYRDRVEVQNSFLSYRIPVSSIIEVFSDGRLACLSLRDNRAVSIAAIPYRERGLLKGVVHRRGHEFAALIETLSDGDP